MTFENGKYWQLIPEIKGYKISHDGLVVIPHDNKMSNGNINWNHGKILKGNVLVYQKQYYSIPILVKRLFVESDVFTPSQLLKLYGFNIKGIAKYIIGFEHKYIITSCGRVFSLFGKNGYLNELKMSIGGTGYKTVALRKNKMKKDIRLHRLLGLHFLDGYFDGAHINHIDGNKLNNDLSNLEWVTPEENVIHSHNTKLCNIKGEKSHHAKLNNELVLKIRKMFNEMSNKEISENLGIPYSTITKITSLKTWKTIS